MCPGRCRALCSPFISKNRTTPDESRTHAAVSSLCFLCVCECNIVYTQADAWHMEDAEHMNLLWFAKDVRNVWQGFVYIMCMCRNFIPTNMCAEANTCIVYTHTFCSQINTRAGTHQLSNYHLFKSAIFHNSVLSRTINSIRSSITLTVKYKHTIISYTGSVG